MRCLVNVDDWSEGGGGAAPGQAKALLRFEAGDRTLVPSLSPSSLEGSIAGGPCDLLASHA